MAKKKGTAEKVHVPEVMEPENSTALIVRSETSVIGKWASNILVFLAGAQELEMAAKARLVRMETLRMPTSGDQDAQIQDLVRLSNAGKKETTDYWYITGALDKLHKWSTTGRKRAIDADEQAASIGNRLHADYVQAERRRAQAEEDRIRREREEAAQRERQAELDKLEAAALKAEATSPSLSERETQFVYVYLRTHNGPQAARQAGYRNPDATALQLLTRDKIKRAIESAETAEKLRQQKVAVETSPVLVEDVEVRPDIQKGGDRTTYSADVYDPIAYREAIISGQYNLDHALLVHDQVGANKLAQSLREQVNRIPGIRLRKVTRVV